MEIDINILQENLSAVKNLMAKRMSRDFIRLHNLCSQSKVISYDIIDLLNRKDTITVKEMIESGNHPPIKYLITFNLKSIVGVNSAQIPIYGNFHQTEIILPRDYPMTTPICTMKTDIWHPNIKSTGFVKGKICYYFKGVENYFYLDSLVISIAEMLQYKKYHAKGDPCPEDIVVAKWVTEFAEPNDIVNKTKNIYVDYNEIFNKKKIEEKEKIKIVFYEEEFLISENEAKNLKLKIAEGLIKETLNVLKSFPIKKSQLNELTIFASRHKEVEKRMNLNILTEENYNLIVNKIHKSILEFIDDLTDSKST